MRPVHRIALAALVGIVLVGATATTLDGDAVVRTLIGIDPRWFLASVVLHQLGLGVRVHRWMRWLHALGVEVHPALAARCCALGWWFNLAVPGRVGELIRPERYARATGTQVAPLFGSVVGERAYDVVVLGVLALIGLTAATEALGYQRGFWVAMALAAAVLLSPSLLRPILRFLPDALRDIAMALLRGLSAGGRFRGELLLWTALIWIVEAASIAALFGGLTGALHPGASALATAASTLGLTIPAGLASMGIDTAVLATAVRPFGLAAELGVALSLASSAATLAAVVPFGLWAVLTWPSGARVDARPPTSER